MKYIDKMMEVLGEHNQKAWEMARAHPLSVSPKCKQYGKAWNNAKKKGAKRCLPRGKAFMRMFHIQRRADIKKIFGSDWTPKSGSSWYNA